MGQQWVRLDSSFPRNHKLLALLGMSSGHRGAVLYLCGLAYAGEQGTDGFIPREALAMLHGRPVDAVHLVDVGLWHKDPGGWTVHDWEHYQPSTEEQHMRSKRARAAAAARWNGHA